MVQELKEKSQGLHNIKYSRLMLWIVLLLVFAFVLRAVWLRYNSQNLVATKPIEQIVNTATTPSNVSDLQLRDAYFMVRIAAIILQKSHDIAVAMELLSAAQENLNTLHGEKIDQAKEMLAADIAKLATIQISDTHVLQDQLAVLEKLSVAMPLKHDAADGPHNGSLAKEEVAPVVSSGRWQQSIQNIVAEAKTIVKVRKKPIADAPLSSVAIEIKHAQFRLLMEQIRWALLSHDADVYKTSIDKMQQLVPEIFDMNNDIVKQFSSVLAEMAKAQINVDVPNIQESVNALKALI